MNATDIDLASIDPGVKPILLDLLARIEALESAPDPAIDEGPRAMTAEYPGGRIDRFEKVE